MLVTDVGQAWRWSAPLLPPPAGDAAAPLLRAPSLGGAHPEFPLTTESPNRVFKRAESLRHWVLPPMLSRAQGSLELPALTVLSRTCREHLGTSRLLAAAV